MLGREKVEKSSSRLDDERARVEAYAREVAREQRAIVNSADSAMEKANRDLKALRHRLEPYVRENSPLEPDAKYRELEALYEKRLKERASLGRAIEVARESVAEYDEVHVAGQETFEG